MMSVQSYVVPIWAEGKYTLIWAVASSSAKYSSDTEKTSAVSDWIFTGTVIAPSVLFLLTLNVK